MKRNFVEVATYEHIDGFYILKRKDTGQEVSQRDFERLEIISFKNENILSPPEEANAVLFLEQKTEDNESIRTAHYIRLKEMIDDDIRSFCTRKVFGKENWINEMRENHDDAYLVRELSD